MVREPDATMPPAPQDSQLMSKHRVLSFKPHLRLKWRGEHRQNKIKQPDHPARPRDSIASSRRIGFSVHTAIAEHFVMNARGELEPLTATSTRPIASTVTHAGIVRTKRFSFAL